MTVGVEEQDELWAAIAEPARRRVLDLLLAHGEATATTLATELPISRQAVVKHLAVLDRTGFVSSRRQGREVRHTVRPERLDEARRRLAEVAAGWEASLATIKRLAEKLD